MKPKGCNSQREDRVSVIVLSVLFVGSLFCLLPQNVMAQQKNTVTQQQQTAPADEEEQMDNAIRKLGFLSGQVSQCKSAEADKTKLEKTSLDLANGILRLFGSDRAFYFAATYGAGATEKIEQSKCPEVIQRYDTAIAKLKVLTTK